MRHSPIHTVNTSRCRWSWVAGITNVAGQRELRVWHLGHDDSDICSVAMIYHGLRYGETLRLYRLHTQVEPSSYFRVVNRGLRDFVHFFTPSPIFHSSACPNHCSTCFFEPDHTLDITARFGLTC